MNTEQLALALVLGMLAVGCTPTDATFGNAVRQTMAAQVVNPEPEYESHLPITDGAKGAAAVERYRTDKVKEPDTIRTTDIETGSPR